MIKNPFLLYLLVLDPVMPHEYLSGHPVGSKGGRGTKMSSVVFETYNKKESSVTYSLSPRIATNVTEGFQQLLNLPSWYCKRPQLLKSLLCWPLHIVNILFACLPNKLDKGTLLKNLPLYLDCWGIFYPVTTQSVFNSTGRCASMEWHSTEIRGGQNVSQ